MLTALSTKPYFLAPAYPILFAAGAVAFERFRPRPWLAWLRPAYVALPPATYARAYGDFNQVLADRFGWESLTQTVERVYAALPPAQRAHACVLTSNYGEAGAPQLLGRPGSLPPVISAHNNYYLVGYAPGDVQGARAIYAHVVLATTERCRNCVSYEQNVPIYVLSDPTSPVFPRLWLSLKHSSPVFPRLWLSLKHFD